MQGSLRPPSTRQALDALAAHGDGQAIVSRARRHGEAAPCNPRDQEAVHGDQLALELSEIDTLFDRALMDEEFSGNRGRSSAQTHSDVAFGPTIVERCFLSGLTIRSEV